MLGDAVTAWSSPMFSYSADGYDKSSLFTTTAQIARQGRRALLTAD
jgi:hypothetical protein